MQASPAKLPDDTWGVRVYDPGCAGDWTGQAVTVQSKGGKSWTSQLTELVSHDEKKGVALYRKAEKNAKPVQQPLPPIAGGAPEADEAWPAPSMVIEPPTAAPVSGTTFTVEVTYLDPTRGISGTFGPFNFRATAEQALVAVAGRTDVSSATLKEV
jgi:hypothetical protein